MVFMGNGFEFLFIIFLLGFGYFIWLCIVKIWYGGMIDLEDNECLIYFFFFSFGSSSFIFLCWLEVIIFVCGVIFFCICWFIVISSLKRLGGSFSFRFSGIFIVCFDRSIFFLGFRISRFIRFKVLENGKYKFFK